MTCYEYLRQALAKITSEMGKRKFFRHDNHQPYKRTTLSSPSKPSKRLRSYFVALENDDLNNYHRRRGR